jgi:hypothetical protein
MSRTKMLEKSTATQLSLMRYTAKYPVDWLEKGNGADS